MGVRVFGVVLVLVVAGCGGGGHRPSAIERQRAQLESDIAALRHAALPIEHATLMGTPAVRRATGRFLEHEETSGAIPAIERNRWIDHAVAIATYSCEQCFQQLEAARPIVEIWNPN
ncbi:MAG: hypothetical protein ACR2MU_03160 [Gaiellaceae bacterium]